MMRVNAVIMITNDGSSVSAVITARICSVTLYFCVPSGCAVTVIADRSGTAFACTLMAAEQHCGRAIAAHPRKV